MGDVTSTCCQNTTQMQQMSITRQINPDQPIDPQTLYTYEPFHEPPATIKETFQQAAQSKYFTQQSHPLINFQQGSDIWTGERIISIVKKYRNSDKSEKSSIFQMISNTESSNRFCTYVKSLRQDNTITENGSGGEGNVRQGEEGQPLVGHSSDNRHSSSKVFTGTFLLYFPNKQYFLGHLHQNHPTNGIFVFKPGCYYVGNINNLTASGEGKYQNKENGYIYEGSWSKNLQHGKGRQMYTTNNEEFQGEFMYGSKFGQGVYKFHDGKIYQGYFYNGHSDGEGRLTIGPKEWYKGEWKLGSIQGKGEYHYANGDVYYGEFENGVKSGRGRYVFAAGYEYDGEWVEGVMHGSGVVKEGYDQIEGQWVDGKKVA